MLTSLLIFIVVCFLATLRFIDFSTFLKRVVCFAIGLYFTVLLTPIVVPVLNNLLGSLLPLVFIRIIVVLSLFFGVQAIAKKIWEKIAESIKPSHIDKEKPSSKVSLFVAVLFNAGLGFVVFILLLLGYALAVDYKLFSPIVSQETYYQTIANGFSGTLFGRTPKSDYIVKVKRADKKPLTHDSGKAEPYADKYKEYEQYDKSHFKSNRSPSPKASAPQTQQNNPRKPNNQLTGKKAITQPAEEETLELPELNLNEKDVEVLQEVVTEEIDHLLKENPEELKRALSEVLTDQKGEELSAVIDAHIREGKNINELMEKIEVFMGDPKNLSPEFKEALPDMLREMEFTKD